MRSRKLALALTSALATMAVAFGAQAASAVFPDFTGCTATNIANEGCIDIQNRSANFNIKGFNVPLGESLEIRGTLLPDGSGGSTSSRPEARPDSSPEPSPFRAGSSA